MYGDKNETIRTLSLYLRETQAQYHDCLSEAAAQATLMELQRDAIQQLQKTIVRKDLIYCFLIIKTQELFRGHIQDVRIVKSKIDGIVKTRKYFEDLYRRTKRLWRETDRELRKLQSATMGDSKTRQKPRCKDSSTSTESAEFELCDDQEKNHYYRVQNLVRGTDVRLGEDKNFFAAEKRELESVLKEHLACARILIAELQHAREKEMSRTDSTSSASQTRNIDTATIKDELHRRNVEIDQLLVEARGKEQELEMLQDMRKEFERTEGLERINERLKKELTILRQTADSECRSRGKLRVIRDSDREVDSRFVSHDESDNQGQQKEFEMIRQFKDQLSSTRELTEDCLEELNSSKEMLGSLRERIFSLKRLLAEKSDELAKLRADHEMIKNDYTILKADNGAFEEKARAEIREFREKLKTLQSELRLANENYQRVSRDFDKSQELLIEAAKREVDLQHAITAMEQVFYGKLSCAEKETRRLGDLADMLRSELENSREEFAAREEDFAERYGDACSQIESLEDRATVLDEANRRLARQLQDSRRENYSLAEENARLMENGCRCVKELEDTHNALLELKGECRAKSRSLDCVSAELTSVATSRTEICEESSNVVACVRVWMDEQRRLVETLSRKLKDERNRLGQLTFEKKALVATVRELMRVNSLLGEMSSRRGGCGGGHERQEEPIGGAFKTGLRRRTSACYSSRCGSRRQTDTASSTVYTRPLKRRCACLTRTTRRTQLRGNSWWFPKLERVGRELCCKSRRHVTKAHDDGCQSETSVDEARDFGYQSSTSK